MKTFIEKLINHFKNAIINYPISTLAVIILFFVSEYFVYKYSSNDTQIILSLIFLILLSLAAYTHNFKKDICKIIALIISILISIAFYYLLPDNLSALSQVQEYYIYITFIIAFGLLFLAGHRKGDNDKNYFEYVISLLIKIGKTFVVSLILFILGNLALLAIKELFNLDFGKTFEYFTVFVFTLFAGIYFIGELQEQEKIEYGKWFKFLLIYILIPAVFVYFIILTIYDIKALFQLPHWPARIVPYLIISFSIIGYITYILSYNLDEAKTFKKYFPILVLVQIPMLIIAIYLRVDQYGLTFNRYLLILFTILLTIISLYYVFSKKKSLIFMFLTTIIGFVLASFGPWSINNLPKISQEKNLVNILKTHKLLSGNTINIEKLKNEKDTTKALIADKIRYLCNYHGCENVDILKPIINQIKSEDKKLSKWEIKNKLFKKLGIEYVYYIPRNSDRIYINSEDKNIYVFGYSYVIPVQQERYKNLYNEGYFITIDEDGNVYLYEDKKLVDKKQIPEDKLAKLFESNKKGEFEFDMGNYKVKLVLLDYELVKNGDKVKLGYVSQAYGLLQRK